MELKKALGRVIVDEAEVGSELDIQFKASEALIDTSFGLYEGVTALVVGRDGESEASGEEIVFTLDIGGATSKRICSIYNN